MRIAILGYGREGRSVMKFLKRHRSYRRATIEVRDQTQGPAYLAGLEQFDLIFRSPGVPYNLPEIRAAVRSGARITSATKLFFELCKSPIIGVTGTKGKGTTSTLIYKILKASGRHALLAGNIGKSPLEILPKIRKNTWVVLELSSFQLWDLEQSPAVAVITDIFPDHQDVHKNMEEYVGAKANITKYQKKSDAVFYFESNALAKKIARRSRGKKIAVAAPDTLEKNKILAATITKYLGCPERVVSRTLNTAKGLEHRMEFVRSLDGVRYYDDSASTNPQTMAAAITSFTEPVIVIAGGKDKNLDYRPVREALAKSGLVRMMILIGENREKIAASIHKSGIPVKPASDLTAAVQLARNRATGNRASIVLFSPGAASFDMFRDYADRGAQFKKIVKHL